MIVIHSILTKILSLVMQVKWLKINKVEFTVISNKIFHKITDLYYLLIEYKIKINNYTKSKNFQDFSKKYFVLNYTGDSLNYHHGMSFSTADVDQDGHSTYNCAENFHGGFWYRSCIESNPNGLYGGKDISGGSYVNWLNFRGYEALKNFEMKFRPNY